MPKSHCKIFFTKDSIQDHPALIPWVQRRCMTSSKRVQDRSKNKRILDLEIATEKHKTISKTLHLLEVLKGEPENIISLRNLDQHRRQINLPKPHKISDFLRKAPALFELYKDPRGVVWCGLTEKAEELAKEEAEIIERHSSKVAEYVTRMLMMAAEKRLAVDKIAHFRRDFGLPVDFQKHWVHNYPEHFKVVQPFKPYDEGEYLELVSWNPDWVVTELEKTVLGIKGGESDSDRVPGLLSLAFPVKFPANYKRMYRREFTMPQKLMRLLLKHLGIFYVSERGKRFSVFLNEAYDGLELIDKHPLVVWREKVLGFVGYRGEKKGSFDDFSDMDDDDKGLFGIDSEDEDDTMRSSENASDADSSEMEIEEVCRAYKD